MTMRKWVDAAQYASTRGAGVLLQITMGEMDRAADISWLSQACAISRHLAPISRHLPPSPTFLPMYMQSCI